MLAHKCAFGVVYSLGKKLTSHPTWSQLTGVQIDSISRELLVKVLSVDKLDVEHGEWCLDLHKDVARKLRAGDHAVGDGKAGSINYYPQLIKACIEKREGKHVMVNYTKYETGDPTLIFNDPQLLRFAEKPMVLAFGFIGLTGKKSNGFLAFWRGVTDRAQLLDNFPQSYPVVKTLKLMLRKAAALAFSSSGEKWTAMVGSALGVLTRPDGFMSSGSNGSTAFVELDMHTKEVTTDLERGLLGLSRIANNPGSSHLVNALVGSDGGGADAGTQLALFGGKRKERETQNQEKWVFDSSVNGANAALHGIWHSKDGVCFGLTLVWLKSGKTWKGTCVAEIALSGWGWKRDLWHMAGCNCKAGHPRPNGVADDDIESRNISREERDKMKCLVEPSQPGSPYKKSSEEKGGGKGGGKGKGKGGGKGKGSPGGKGAKKNFQRQH